MLKRDKQLLEKHNCFSLLNAIEKNNPFCGGEYIILSSPSSEVAEAGKWLSSEFHEINAYDYEGENIISVSSSFSYLENFELTNRVKDMLYCLDEVCRDFGF